MKANKAMALPPLTACVSKFNERCCYSPRAPAARRSTRWRFKWSLWPALLCLLAATLSARAQVVAGTALQFDGVNDAVVLTNVSGLSPGNTPHSIEMWVNIAALPWPRSWLLLLGNPGTGSHHWLLNDNRTAHFGAWGIASVQFTVRTGAWLHVATTFDGTTLRAYTNGTLAGSLNVTFNLQGLPLALAQQQISGAEAFFKGALDEVRVWNKARTASEIQLDMNRSLVGTETGLLVYYRFDEGSGSVAMDASGHGNHGTLTNRPTWVASGAPIRGVVATLPATAISHETAALQGLVDPQGMATAGWFEWGTTTNYGNATPAQDVGNGTNDVAISQIISNLQPDTVYHFRCVAMNAQGRFNGLDGQFKTAGPPIVTTLSVTNMSPSTATLQGAVVPNGLGTLAWFEWGTTTNYSSSTPLQSAGSGLSSVVVTQAVAGLIAGQEYHYRALATNAAGFTAGLDQRFWTHSFSNAAVLGFQFYEGDIYWGDFDNDGWVDMLALMTEFTNGDTFMYHNVASAFTRVAATLPRVRDGAAAWGDYDHDGDLDVLISGTSLGNPPFPWGPICLVVRNDGGTFSDAHAGLPGIYNSAVAWGDYDNDGDLDIMICGRPDWSGNPPITRVYRNDRGVFSDAGANLPGIEYGAAAWGDYDNDGDLDILLMGSTDSYGSRPSITRVFRNDNGVFTDIGAGLPGLAKGSAAWGDYDNDGYLDILLVGQRDAAQGGGWIARIYRNDNGNFVDANVGFPDASESKAAWADYDNDGDLDVVLTGRYPSLPFARVYQNDNGVFTDIGAGLAADRPGSPAWCDFDNDGRLDLGVAGGITYPTLGVAVYRSYVQATPTNPTTPFPPSGLTASVLNNGVWLSWQAGSDDRTPVRGLTYNVRVGTTRGGDEVLGGQCDLVFGQRRVPQMGNAQHRLFTTLTNLPIGLYYWSVQTVDGTFAGSPFASEERFSVTNGPPVVTTLPASNVLCCSALLNGEVIPGGTPTAAWFEWGTTTNFGNATPLVVLGTGLSRQSVQQPLASLRPRTRYYFRLAATNSTGLVLGTNQTFTTEGPAPLVATRAVSNLTYTSAGLFGTSPLSNPPAEYLIEWGATTNYGNLVTAAVVNAALKFDGVDDYLAVGWGKFPTVTNTFTIELWAKPTAARSVTVESVSGTAGLGGQRFAVLPDQGTVGYGSAAHVGAGLSIGTNGVSVAEHTDWFMPTVLVHTGSVSGWTHVALVYSNHLPRLYLNGSVVRTGLVSDKIVHPGASLGGDTNKGYGQFEGALEEVRVWDAALPANIIQAWMNVPLTAQHPAYGRLRGYWPLEEGRGLITADLSPAGNQGYLRDGTTWTAGRLANEIVFGAEVTGLLDGTTYHFRAVAVNPGGMALGQDQAFTTLARPTVLGLTPQADHSWLLQFSGTPSCSYTLEASTNLIYWTELANLLAGPEGLFDFLDTSGTNCPTRFYRLKVP